MNASADQDADLVVEIARQGDVVEVDCAAIERLVRAIWQRFGKSGGSISIVLVDDAEIRRANRRFLGSEATTDVLSFDLSDPEVETGKPKTSGVAGGDGGGLFEVLVNAELAVREAKERGHSARAELALYVTHGLLHQLGFDDLRPEEAEKMHKVENEILRELGFGAVYGS